MKIHLDFDKKTFQVKDNVNFKELYKKLSSLLEDIDEWTMGPVENHYRSTSSNTMMLGNNTMMLGNIAGTGTGTYSNFPSTTISTNPYQNNNSIDNVT